MYKFIKRTFDIVLSLFGIIVCLPIFIFIFIWIKIDSRGPVFFKHRRVGQKGKILYIYKFRTMVKDAETMVSNFTEAQKKEWEENYKLKNDPRITKAGKFLRKTSLDELPQLFNILKGEMSFVGPRPDVAGYADKLQGDDRKILELRPGITGPASIKYRHEDKILAQQKDPKKYNDEIIYPDKVRINLDYYENWSFFLDIKIIFQTLFG